MGLLQVGVSILTSLLIGALTRFARLGGTARTYLLLIASVLAVYWFQPLVPLRSFDFWLPSLTLGLVLLVWFQISRTGTQTENGTFSWRAPHNRAALFLIFGLPCAIVLSRYVLPDPLLTASHPPQISPFLLFVISAALILLALSALARRSLAILSATIILLILILIVLKSPALSLQTSIFIRTVTNRSVETAAFTDLRWLGISYIAFRLIHVLRDRQAGRLPELSLAEFAAYVVFFPSLAAGPIDRAERFVQDLRKEFVLTQDETLLGGGRIVLGLFKKFVVADTLALVALNDLLASQIGAPGWMWIAVYAYAFQIYFDFSGYTDIAIGVARLVGVRLPENFAAPYLKPNLTQFWNSWHMTLTQWFRSYFFNPFNRWMRGLKTLPTWTMILLGQAATMLLIGLWHGITLNFIFWGLWHGLGLFLQNRWSDFLRTRYPAAQQTPRRASLLQIGGIVVTFHFVALGWVFFALSDPTLSWQVMLKLFGLSPR
ncbi:MAG TPA: MBOAT family O-acyltransferase [Anaerolineales bacterium]|nr:MBOAT family O-acyltransferase [Anaerolineales bacterium]